MSKNVGQGLVPCRQKGVTLTELMIVVAIIGVLFVAIQPYFYTLRRVWHVSDGRSDILQNGRIGLDKMVSELRQATGFSSVTASTEAAGNIVFNNKDGNSVEFKRYNDGTRNMLGYVQGGGTSPLAGPVNSLKFTCFTTDGLTQTTSAGAIKSINIDLEVADPRGQISSMTLSSRAFVRQDAITASYRVINEIMYNPSGGGSQDQYYEYIEFYNGSANAVDFAGWQLRDEGAHYVDNLVGDVTHGGSGTTIVPAGGYALITDQDTKVYDPGSPYIVPAGAIKLQVDDDNILNGLHDNDDTIFIVDNTGAIVDQVHYYDTWGGDGNGRSLERISPSGPTNDPSNWKESPLNGTPGSVNL